MKCIRFQQLNVTLALSPGSVNVPRVGPWAVLSKDDTARRRSQGSRGRRCRLRERTPSQKIRAHRLVLWPTALNTRAKSSNRHLDRGP